MTFTESIRTCIRQKYATFRDRASRSEFWWFVLFNMIVGIVAGLFDSLLGFAPQADLVTGNGAVSASYQASGPITVITSLALLVPNLAVAVRRLHDTGRSGWWLLIVLIPLIGALILLWWYIKPSEPGTNKWGPNPQGIDGPPDGGGTYAPSRVPEVER